MKYKQFYIERNPPEARQFKWHYVHKDYDGWEDTRTGSCKTVLECIAEINSEDERNLSHEDYILSELIEGRSLTPLEALGMFGCFRLAARISDLRDKGYPIKTEVVKKDNKHFARYFLENV